MTRGSRCVRSEAEGDRVPSPTTRPDRVWPGLQRRRVRRLPAARERHSYSQTTRRPGSEKAGFPWAKSMVRPVILAKWEGHIHVLQNYIHTTSALWQGVTRDSLQPSTHGQCVGAQVRRARSSCVIRFRLAPPPGLPSRSATKAGRPPPPRRRPPEKATRRPDRSAGGHRNTLPHTPPSARCSTTSPAGWRSPPHGSKSRRRRAGPGSAQRDDYVVVPWLDYRIA